MTNTLLRRLLTVPVLLVSSLASYAGETNNNQPISASYSALQSNSVSSSSQGNLENRLIPDGKSYTNGAYTFSFNKGASISEQSDKIVMNVPDGSKIEMPKIEEKTKPHEKRKEYVWIGKNLEWNRGKINGTEGSNAELCYQNGNLFIKRSVNISNLGDLVSSPENSRVYLFNDKEFHPELDGVYIAFSNEGLILASNNGELSPIIIPRSIEKSNLGFVRQPNSEMSVQVFPKGFFIAIKREGNIPLTGGYNMRLNNGKFSYHLTPDGYFYTEQGNLISKIEENKNSKYVGIQFVPLDKNRHPLLKNKNSVIFDTDGFTGWIPYKADWDKLGLYAAGNWHFSPKLSWNLLSFSDKQKLSQLPREEQLAILNKETEKRLEEKVVVKPEIKPLKPTIVNPSIAKPSSPHLIPSVKPNTSVERRVEKQIEPSYTRVLKKWDSLIQGAEGLTKLVSQIEKGIDLSTTSQSANQDGFDAQKYNRIFGTKGRKLDNKHDLIMLEFSDYYCAPCNNVLPEIEAVAESMENVKIITIDGERFPSIQSAYRIVAWPTAVFLDARTGELITEKSSNGDEWTFSLGGKKRDEIIQTIREKLIKLRNLHP